MNLGVHDLVIGAYVTLAGAALGAGLGALRVWLFGLPRRESNPGLSLKRRVH